MASHRPECPNCGKKFANKTTLESHVVLEHTRTASEVKSEGKVREAPTPRSGSNGIRWAPRSDVGHVEGDFYELKISEEAYDRYHKEKDPTRRWEKIARGLRLMPGIDPPSKSNLSSALKQDAETIFRKLEGISLVGSRGKPLEEAICGGDCANAHEAAGLI